MGLIVVTPLESHQCKPALGSLGCPRFRFLRSFWHHRWRARARAIHGEFLIAPSAEAFDCNGGRWQRFAFFQHHAEDSCEPLVRAPHINLEKPAHPPSRTLGGVCCCTVTMLPNKLPAPLPHLLREGLPPTSRRSYHHAGNSEMLLQGLGLGGVNPPMASKVARCREKQLTLICSRPARIRA